MGTTLPTAASRATLADLQRAPGKAELIDGEIIPLMPTGLRPNLIAGRIYRSLADHADATGRGIALTDNMGFAVPALSSGRQSFSPDAAYYDGPLPANAMRFVEGPPTLAVEVRSEGDYDSAARREIAAKRSDYFEAGAKVVWDVDTLAEQIHVYRSDAPDAPQTFAKGQEADAEPAVPGWRIGVDRVFLPGPAPSRPSGG